MKKVKGGVSETKFWCSVLYLQHPNILHLYFNQNQEIPGGVGWNSVVIPRQNSFCYFSVAKL